MKSAAPRKKTDQSRMASLLILPLAWISRVLPLPWAQRLGAALGDLLFLCIRRYREVARRNLTMAFGWEAEQVEGVARQVFRNVGQTLVEFLRLPAMSAEEIRRLVPLEGVEHLHAGLAAGRGLLLITGHFGNWELLGARLVVEGIPLSVVARDADDPMAHALINRIRTECGYRVISRQSAHRGVLEALRRNEAVAILMDQNTIEGGQFVPFFGKMAATVTGPAVFALRTGAAVIPGFIVRRPDGTHVGTGCPPVALPQTGDREADVLALTAHLTGIIEAHVRADPAQWLWIHDRWRHRPPEERREAADRQRKPDGANTHDDVSPYPATEP
jgi:KDO2-lipid IV(A) lauroyltransferase